jgi:hypothetical protein
MYESAQEPTSILPIVLLPRIQHLIHIRVDEQQDLIWNFYPCKNTLKNNARLSAENHNSKLNHEAHRCQRVAVTKCNNNLSKCNSPQRAT